MPQIRRCFAAGMVLPTVLVLAACAGQQKRPTVATPEVKDEAVPVRSNDPLAYRFDMQQNGRKMSADEFDAWMKARGIRIATGAPAQAPAPAKVSDRRARK